MSVVYKGIQELLFFKSTFPYPTFKKRREEGWTLLSEQMRLDQLTADKISPSVKSPKKVLSWNQYTLKPLNALPATYCRRWSISLWECLFFRISLIEEHSFLYRSAISYGHYAHMCKIVEDAHCRCIDRFDRQAERQIERLIDWLIDWLIEWLMDWWIDGWMNGGMERLIDGWMDGWMDTYIHTYIHTCIHRWIHR